MFWNPGLTKEAINSAQFGPGVQQLAAFCGKWAAEDELGSSQSSQATSRRSDREAAVRTYTAPNTQTYSYSHAHMADTCTHTSTCLWGNNKAAERERSGNLLRLQRPSGWKVSVLVHLMQRSCSGKPGSRSAVNRLSQGGEVEWLYNSFCFI